DGTWRRWKDWRRGATESGDAALPITGKAGEYYSLRTRGVIERLCVPNDSDVFPPVEKDQCAELPGLCAHCLGQLAPERSPGATLEIRAGSPETAPDKPGAVITTIIHAIIAVMNAQPLYDRVL